MHLPTLTFCSLSLKLTLIVFFCRKRNDKARFIPGATGVQPIYYTLTQRVQFKYFSLLHFIPLALFSSPFIVIGPHNYLILICARTSETRLKRLTISNQPYSDQRICGLSSVIQY
jgi:hypothetical protein